jgi:anti-sigma regulatory factor (Ser/Thr protein kinase)
VTTRREFPNSLQSIAQARHFAIDALAELPEPLVENATLIVSELATNCLRHAQTAFDVDIVISGGQVQISVTDSGEGEPEMRSPAPTDHSGRGLRIVELLATEWGIAPATPQRGKTVWFRLTVDDQSREGAG